MIQVVYNGVALETLGDVTVSGPGRTYEPAEAPQRIHHSLRIVVDIFPTGYLAGHQAIEAIIAALKQQHVVLKWGEKGPPEVNFVNRTVTLRDADLPEDPNAWGTYHRRIVLSVGWVEKLTDAEAQNVGEGNHATFREEGGTITLNLTNITTWQESLRASWLHDRRNQRDRSEGRVTVAGSIQSDTSVDLESRRASLLAAHALLQDAMDGKIGRLERKIPRENYSTPVLGDFAQDVRIEDFAAEINQAATAIGYSFTARYTRWPPENDYSTERFTLSEQRRREDGQIVVNFRGSIQANAVTTARARLDTLRTAVQGTYPTGTVIRLLTSDLDLAYISSGDQTITSPANVALGFIELSFAESWLVFSAVTRELSLRYGPAVKRSR